jgi:hypothetical protein
MGYFNRRSFLGWTAGAAALLPYNATAADQSGMEDESAAGGREASGPRALAAGALASGLPYVDCRDHGAVPDSGREASIGLTLAFAAAAAVHRPLFIPPGGYRVSTPVSWTGTQRVDVMARGATLEWFGGAGPALTYGGIRGRRANYSRLDGLHVENHGDRAATGVILQDLAYATIELESVSDFGTGLCLFGNGDSVVYSRLRFNALRNAVGVKMNAVGNGVCCNRLTFFDCLIQNVVAATMIRVEPAAPVPGGWIWNDCDFESDGPNVLLEADCVDNWAFNDCWFESSQALTLKVRRPSRIVVRGGQTYGLALDRSPLGVVVVP